jgi:SnoaL-like domain
VETVDETTAGELRRHWNDGWNNGDVDTIMAPFAANVVFRSPFVSRMTGDPGETAIEGYEALRSYVAGALVRAPGIRYTVDATFTGADSIVLAYTVHRHGRDWAGADWMRVDGEGKVTEWSCHYDPAFISSL